MIRDRHRAVVDIILDELRRPEESMTIRTVVECAAVLERTGFECPSWEDLAKGRSLGESRLEEDPSLPRVGWQQQVATSIERHYHDNTVWPGLQGARAGHDEIPEGSVGEHRFHVFPDESDDQDRLCSISRPSPPQTSFAPSSVSPQLPVWLSTRRPWPPPSSMRDSRGLGAVRVGS